MNQVFLLLVDDLFVVSPQLKWFAFLKVYSCQKIDFLTLTGVDSPTCHNFLPVDCSTEDCNIPGTMNRGMADCERG